MLSGMCCELLSKSYLCFTDYNCIIFRNLRAVVVSCFQNRIFVLPDNLIVAGGRCCELLSKSYLCFTDYNPRSLERSLAGVVSCFQNRIFVLLITTKSTEWPNGVRL